VVVRGILEPGVEIARGLQVESFPSRARFVTERVLWMREAGGSRFRDIHAWMQLVSV
jgi:hypothetical protein